jgi:hypothetical protein
MKTAKRFFVAAGFLFHLSILFTLFALSAAAAWGDAKEDLELLAAAYPGAFEPVSDQGIRLPDGTLLPYDDGKQKDFETLLEDPDLEDMLRLPYPLGAPEKPPALNEDPGRFRPGAFFQSPLRRERSGDPFRSQAGSMDAFIAGPPAFDQHPVWHRQKTGEHHRRS